MISLICNARDKSKSDLYGPDSILPSLYKSDKCKSRGHSFQLQSLLSVGWWLSGPDGRLFWLNFVSYLFCIIKYSGVPLFALYSNSTGVIRFSRTLTDLYAIDACMCHTTFSLWCHFRQCPWGIGSALAERGSGRVSTLGPGNMAASGLIAVGQHWVGHFSPPLHKWA